MKKLLPLFTLAAVMLAACSKTEEPGLPGGDAIVLKAGMPTAVAKPLSRGVIGSGDKFTAAVIGWESQNAVDYTAASRWSTTAEITANVTAQTVTLAADQVYNANNAVKTYMKAWYPQGTLNAGKVSFTGDASYKGDGTDDVLLAAEVSGSKSDRNDKVLAFTHLTTQLQFKVVGEQSLEAATSVTAIKLKSVQVPSGIDLGTDELTGAAAADLTLPGLGTSVEIPIKNDAGEAAPATAGEPVMILPLEGNSLKVDVTTNNATYENVTVTIDDDTDFQAGKAYEITLTFKQFGIELSATVAEWQPGTGSGTVE